MTSSKRVIFLVLQCMRRLGVIPFPRFENCLQLLSPGTVNSCVGTCLLLGGPGGLDLNLLFCKLFKTLRLINHWANSCYSKSATSVPSPPPKPHSRKGITTDWKVTFLCQSKSSLSACLIPRAVLGIMTILWIQTFGKHMIREIIFMLFYERQSSWCRSVSVKWRTIFMTIGQNVRMVSS